jgi:Ca2+-binding RTX toxin-like protein
MSGTGRRWIAAAALALGLLVVLAPATAQAAVTVGQSPPSAGAPTACGPTTDFADAVQLSSASGNPYVVPAGGGVITSWRTSVATGSLQVKLRVFTGNATAITPLAESAVESITPGGQTQFPTRVPVGGGELLGFAFMGDATGCANNGAAAGDVIGIAVPSGPLGQSEAVDGTGSNFLLNISANLEPDLDKDGFGDETQDQCPTQAATQGPCIQCKGKVATIVGTNSPETIAGTSGADVIAALGGNDTVNGANSNDIICGGSGNDLLKGGVGKDKLFGDRGKDTLKGGGGKGDLCNGGKGSDDAKGSCEKERSI